MTAAQPAHQEQASGPAKQAFVRVAEPFRSEIELHCAPAIDVAWLERYPQPPRPTLAQQKLLGRFLQVWKGHDLDSFVEQAATSKMPPLQQCYAGREVIGSCFVTVWKHYGGVRLPNRQLAAYERSGIPAVGGALHPRACV